MSRAIHHVIFLVAGITLIAGIPFSAVAQTSSDIDTVAARTTEELLKTQPKILLIAPRETCNLSVQICKEFDSALRSKLQQAVPQLRIIGNEDAIIELKNDGFLAIDAYNPLALRLVALATKAEAVVTEDLWREDDGYILRIDIRDPKTDLRLVPFHTLEVKASRSISDPSENPILVTDPESNAAIIIFNGRLPKNFVYPGCDKCPNPRNIGTAGVVQAIGTITVQGKVENISILSSPSADFTKAALETMKSWRFRPAVGLDGRAFPARQNIEVTFPH